MSHVYIHVPFCARRCSYCDFSIAVRRRIPADEYVTCIMRESVGQSDGRTVGREMFSAGGIRTLYFGGGTPSLLPAESIRRLISHALGAGPPSDTEITLEANPEDVTPDNAHAWRAAGINRISLGAQSFDDAVLRWMHRSHDARRTGEAVAQLRSAGFENISLDLIFALPDELKRDWASDLERAIALEPTHLSLYGLTVEERTPLARWVSRGATSAPSGDRYAEEYLLAHERLAARGYDFYEVSNAARPGFTSRHNSAYWSGAPYTGLGPAAHSFTGRSRRWNLSAWQAYRDAVMAELSPVESEEVLTDEDRDLESVYLGLRTSAGVPIVALCRPLPSVGAHSASTTSLLRLPPSSQMAGSP